jgi:hypothetical protein
MSQYGKDMRAESSVYLAAWAFSKKLDMQGIKTTPNKKAKKNEGDAGKDSVPSIDSIELEDEKEDKVPVFGKLRNLHYAREPRTDRFVNGYMQRRSRTNNKT